METHQLTGKEDAGYKSFPFMKQKIICFTIGRRSSGYFDIRRLDGTKVHAGVSYKKLRFLETRHTMLTERRTAV